MRDCLAARRSAPASGQRNSPQIRTGVRSEMVRPRPADSTIPGLTWPEREPLPARQAMAAPGEFCCPALTGSYRLVLLDRWPGFRQ